MKRKDAPPPSIISTSESSASISPRRPTVIYGRPMRGTTPPFSALTSVWAMRRGIFFDSFAAIQIPRCQVISIISHNNGRIAHNHRVLEIIIQFLIDSIDEDGEEQPLRAYP